METRARQVAGWLGRRDRRVWASTALAALAVYLLTAHWQTGQVNDAQAAVWPAWQFVHTGSFDLAGARDLPDNMWFTPLGDRVVCQRMMGVILAGIPFAAVAPWLHAEQVGALAGAAYSAGAVANLHLVLRRLVPGRTALLGAALFACGTPLWTTGAAELWGHGPDAFFISLTLLALQRQRYVLAGLAIAPGVLVRPYLAVSAAVLGLVLAAAHRRPAILVAYGLPAASLVPTMPLWNGWYYGTSNIGGPYQAKIDAAVAPTDSTVAWTFVKDLAGSFLSPEVGLFAYSPVFLLLVLRLVPAWRSAPDWVRASALAGVAYEVLQLRGNRYSGGGAFYSNRLIVELVVFTFPLLVLAVAPLLERGGRWATLVVALGSTSVAVHLFGAFSAYHWRGTVQHWWLWYPWHVAHTWGLGALPLVLTAVAVPVVAVLAQRQHDQQVRVDVPAQRAWLPAEAPARS
ncbi:MAG: hypothetical protein JWM64_2043 [Frankiales bacterium]|nr:hypothetical protein [Frankiales bacterium]